MSSICGLAYNLGASEKIRLWVGWVCAYTLGITFFVNVHVNFGLEAMLVFWTPLFFFSIFTKDENLEKIILEHSGQMAALTGLLIHIELMGWFVSLFCFLGYWAMYLMDERITELMEENEKLKKAMEEVESTEDIVVVEEADLSAMEMEDDEEEEEFDFEVIRYKDILIA
ncbi:hypothetical protein CAEBREN_15195 [Caenorhabditis brenneri]|uniref:Uncharacterized protein n=1 Tax=Caenorhabditis brenneri TaxID=135651 RepID=G0PE06_CAEBE|nr:hypothetical protein CAEBREN_15195 [Caenorhabditis brenneri]